jgi:serine acetyltransferase
VIGGIVVGSGSYVCAGAVVTKDIPRGVIVSGVNRISTPDEWHGPLGKSDFFPRDRAR